MTIGNRIKAIRLKRNFTQKYIARGLGMTHANYGKLENGKIRASRSRIDIIATLLEVNVEQILYAGKTETDSSVNDLSYTGAESSREITFPVKSIRDLPEIKSGCTIIL